jgi:hypothetical protein
VWVVHIFCKARRSSLSTYLSKLLLPFLSQQLVLPVEVLPLGNRRGVVWRCVIGAHDAVLCSGQGSV